MNLHAHAVGVRKREAGMPSVFVRSERSNEAGQGWPWQPARAVPGEATRERATKEGERMHGT
jgi:hypothetical protein